MRTARSLPYREVSALGSLSREVSVWGSLSRGSLSRKVHSVQGVYVQGVSVQGVLCPVGDLCPVGVLCPGDLCQGDHPGQKPPGRNMGENPWKEHGTRDRELPRRNMGPNSQTGSDIIQRSTCEQNDTYENKNNTLPQTSWRENSNIGNRATYSQRQKCLTLCHYVRMDPCCWISYRYGMHCSFRT